MRVLVIGATGYIGSVVAERLVATGHEVCGLARSAEATSTLTARQLEARAGALEDPDSLERAADDVDAVIQLAAPTGDSAIERGAVAALLRGLGARGRTLLYTSGVWVLGTAQGGPANERSAPQPAAIVAWRPAIERAVLDAGGVRGIVLRPGIVHGRAGGIPALVAGWAKAAGTGRYVGAGEARWPTVHVEDLAELYRLALERGAAGALFHGVAEEGVTIRAIAMAADRAAGGTGRAKMWPLEAARPVLGADFADALARDQVVSSAWTCQTLGWRPERPGIVAELAEGSYRGA